MRPQASIRDAVLGLALLSCACQAERAPEPAALIGPSAELAKRAVSALLPGLQFGPDQAQHTIRELRAIDVPGSHYTPATDRWTVHYCAEFLSYASDAPQRRCDLAVDVYRLDSGRWVGFARGAGTLYRWQVLDEGAGAGMSPSAENETAPGAGAKPAP